MDEQGLTGRALGAKADVSHSHISRILSGSRSGASAGWETVQRLAGALGVEPTTLIVEELPPPPPPEDAGWASSDWDWDEEVGF